MKTYALIRKRTGYTQEEIVYKVPWVVSVLECKTWPEDGGMNLGS